MESIKETIVHYDRRASLALFRLNSSHAVVKLFVTFYNLSSDEGLWFAVSLITNFFLLIQRPLRDLDLYKTYFPYSGETQESTFIVLNDIFGCICLSASIEQILKVIFQRTRPDYQKQKKDGWSILWEYYSFPSGHTMRTAYLFQYFHYSRILKMIVPAFEEFANLPGPTVFLMTWAVFVAYARISAGKHYLIDTIVGAICGHVLGFYVESEANYETFCWMKLAAKLNIAVQFWFIMVEREAKNLKLPKRIILGVQCFYVVYLLILLKETFF